MWYLREVWVWCNVLPSIFKVSISTLVCLNTSHSVNLFNFSFLFFLFCLPNIHHLDLSCRFIFVKLTNQWFCMFEFVVILVQLVHYFIFTFFYWCIIFYLHPFYIRFIRAFEWTNISLQNPKWPSEVSGWWYCGNSCSSIWRNYSWSSFLSMTLSVVTFHEKYYSSWMTVSDGFGLFLVSRPSSSQRCPIGDNLKTILATATLECDYSPKFIKMCLQRAFSV